MQENITLIIPKCSAAEIAACDSPLSRNRVITDDFEFAQHQDGSPVLVCEKAVPGACPRVQCFHEPSDQYLACRLLALIRTEDKEGSVAMTLPCSECEEKRMLERAFPNE